VPFAILQKAFDTVGREGGWISGNMDKVVESLGDRIVDIDSSIFGSNPYFSIGTRMESPDFIAVEILPVVGHSPEIPELLFAVHQKINAGTGADPGIPVPVVEDVKD
jgi:hypothetical protein